LNTRYNNAMHDNVILCSTARLARSLQSDLARTTLEPGATACAAAPVFTQAEWLDSVIEDALLCGEISAAPALLSPFNEQMLWQSVIAQSLQKNMLADLFDINGLSEAAIEANRYVIVWKLPLPHDKMTEETRQFVQWQRAFQARCEALQVLEAARYLDWQLDCLKNGIGQLPQRIAFAGYDQIAPQEQRLRDILAARGVEVQPYVTTHAQSAHAYHIRLTDQDAECRAAVAWAAKMRAENKTTRLAIITPKLDAVRNRLADLLDDLLHPETAQPCEDTAARDYNFSLGTPLAQQPAIQAALNLLHLLGGYQLAQSDISRLLLSPFWSASVSEADARAQLDAQMRENLPAQLTIASWLNFVARYGRTPHLLADMQAALALTKPNKQAASGWASQFAAVLQALRWPGERSLTSMEYQLTAKAWQKALDQLAALDILGNPLNYSAALRAMQQICTVQIFQPESTQTAPIQILGMMETLSTPVDAAWVMGMNDHIWPPPARPNPLLPASVQRNAKLPNADNHVQAAFAALVHKRILHSAPEITFSSSLADGDSQLRASPLMQDITVLDAAPLAATLAETLSAEKSEMEHLPDHIAPAVQPGEHVRGGTGLFAAQAKCPAWAFYRYRLGAKALEVPVSGLDAMTRGTLVHDTLAHFWHHDTNHRNFSDLHAMSPETRHEAVQKAASRALADMRNHHQFSPTLLKLEQERLEKLVDGWLQFELGRGVNFDTIACEAEKTVMINGIEVKLKIDRIHAADGSDMVFVDYKTGTKPAIANWGEARITEPQLPIYATFYNPNLIVSSLQFGMVKAGEYAFSGVSQADFDADKPKGLAQQFDDWNALQAHWKACIEAIANEVKSGLAAVIFSDEKALTYCEVLPLLRLPERKLQFERLRETS
jgi:exodeoxyribonuclease-5